MKMADLIVGAEYMSFLGADVSSAYGLQRFRLLSSLGVDKASAPNAPGLDVEIAGVVVHVPGAVVAKTTGTHRIFGVMNPKTGQPKGEIVILTPDQVQYLWADGVALVHKSMADKAAAADALAKDTEAQAALVSSASGRISALVPDVSPDLVASPDDVTAVVINGDTLTALLDLVQRAKFGAV